MEVPPPSSLPPGEKGRKRERGRDQKEQPKEQQKGQRTTKPRAPIEFLTWTIDDRTQTAREVKNKTREAAGIPGYPWRVIADGSDEAIANGVGIILDLQGLNKTSDDTGASTYTANRFNNDRFRSLYINQRSTPTIFNVNAYDQPAEMNIFAFIKSHQLFSHDKLLRTSDPAFGSKLSWKQADCTYLNNSPVQPSQNGMGAFGGSCGSYGENLFAVSPPAGYVNTGVFFRSDKQVPNVTGYDLSPDRYLFCWNDPRFVQPPQNLIRLETTSSTNSAYVPASGNMTYYVCEPFDRVVNGKNYRFIPISYWAFSVSLLKLGGFDPVGIVKAGGAGWPTSIPWCVNIELLRIANSTRERQIPNQLPFTGRTSEQNYFEKMTCIQRASDQTTPTGDPSLSLYTKTSPITVSVGRPCMIYHPVDMMLHNPTPPTFPVRLFFPLGYAELLGCCQGSDTGGAKGYTFVKPPGFEIFADVRSEPGYSSEERYICQLPSSLNAGGRRGPWLYFISPTDGSTADQSTQCYNLVSGFCADQGLNKSQTTKGPPIPGCEVYDNSTSPPTFLYNTCCSCWDIKTFLLSRGIDPDKQNNFFQELQQLVTFNQCYDTRCIGLSNENGTTLESGGGFKNNTKPALISNSGFANCPSATTFCNMQDISFDNVTGNIDLTNACGAEGVATLKQNAQDYPPPADGIGGPPQASQVGGIGSGSKQIIKGLDNIVFYGILAGVVVLIIIVAVIVGILVKRKRASQPAVDSDEEPEPAE